MNAATPEKVYIIGIGGDGPAGLTERARRILAEADLVLGAESTLDQLGPGPGERLAITHDLTGTVERIQRDRGRKRVVLLASGDPLFYGVARYVCDRVGKEHFEVLPHVSSMQLAFARIKESWEDAYLSNVAGRPIETIIDRIRTAEKVGLFTSEEYPPAAIAQRLLDEGIDYFRAAVCENLGGPDEWVTQADLHELVGLEFKPLNVLILIRKPDRPDRPRGGTAVRRFGNPDDVFRQSRPTRGLITQAEVRAIALAQLDLRGAGVVWDIGAGSGSVAIEAAQLADQGEVFAIEPNPEDFRLIADNAARFAVGNVRPVLGRAPQALADLPDPDAVFVGATGREVVGLLGLVYGRLRPGGRLVVNVASLENLTAARAALRALEPEVSIWMVNICRGVHQLDSVRFEAVNPTFLLALCKGGGPEYRSPGGGSSRAAGEPPAGPRSDRGRT